MSFKHIATSILVCVQLSNTFKNQINIKIMGMNSETSLIMKHNLNWCKLIYSLLRLEYTSRFVTQFSTDLQSGEVDGSCQISESADLSLQNL